MTLTAATSSLYGQAPAMGNIIPKQGIYEQSAIQMADLGDIIKLGGRTYRYCKNGGTALVKGKFVKSLGSPQIYKVVAAATTAGAYAVTLTTTQAITTATEGYLNIEAGTGAGQFMKIKSMAANATTATSTDIVTYDPIITALDTTSYGTIEWSPYKDVVVASAITDNIVGVPTIAVTAEYYFWAQTWGAASVISEGVAPAGALVQVAVSDATATGGVTTMACGVTSALAGTAVSQQALGRMINVGVDRRYKSVFLMIDAG